ncbi:MAG TPA: hypothetical protein VL337_17295, partial [Acidimicrobiales bacterium]|nr:hypothetical protein [Acidimicrobiales bacterium]
MPRPAAGVLLGLVLAIALVLAPAAPAGAEPLHQRVTVYFLDFSDFDVATGTFQADMYLSFHCSRECDPHFDFRNGTVLSSQVRKDTGTVKEYRVRA